MRRILFLVLLAGIGLYGAESTEINEYKVDLYYANGIMMQDDKDKAEQLWKTRVDDLLSERPYLMESINDAKVSYNLSNGLVADMWESFKQKEGLEIEGKLGWYAFKKFIGMLGVYGKGAEYIISAAEYANEYLQHEETLKKQVTQYENSIKAGHGVIVTAHSQGNLFTHEAYNELENWMKPYFHMVSVASPSSSPSVNDGGGATFDNDAILLVPGATHMYATTNPNRHDYRQITKNAAGEVIENKFYTDAPSIQYHSFEYYMGYPVYEDALMPGSHDVAHRKERQTDVAKNAILNWIDYEIDQHHKSPSQWVVKKQLGCPGRCDFRLSLKHITDIGKDNLYWYKPSIVMNKPVIPFIPPEKAFSESNYGKLYKVQGEYVKTDSHYANIREEVKKNGICQITRNSEHMGGVLSEFKGSPYPRSKTVKGGVVGIMLTWDMCYPDVDLDLKVDWDAGYLDVHDDKNSSFEHFVIESKYDIFPSDDPHPVYATDKTDRSKIDPKRIATEDPIDIAVIAYAPGTNKTFKTKITRLDQLDLGHILDIYARKGYNYTDIGDARFIRGKGEDPCEGDKSCGCIPCSYEIVGFLKMALFGPISGGGVKIYNVDNGNVVYEGRTRKSDDITEAGVIVIPESKQESFKDEDIYLIEVNGGEDIDNDDDLYLDAVPTQNKGTLHAIVTGKEIKHLSFKVNILSEIAYQVSKDLLGGDKEILREHLDDVAKRIFRGKVLSMDGSSEINYDDILVWIPAIDKKNLKKDYATHVEPIVQKVYANEDRVKLAYDFVYQKAEKGAPELSSLHLEIPNKLPKGMVIGNFNILSQGDGEIDRITLAGEGNEHFEVDRNGIVGVKNLFDAKNQTFYALKATAVNDGNHSSVPVELAITVAKNKGIVDANASIPYATSMKVNSIEENSPAGTPVAEVVFHDDNDTIISYEIGGRDKDAFSVTSDGVIVVSSNADIDYEKQETMHLNIAAINTAGNKSFPVPIVVKIKDVMDTPAYKMFLVKHIKHKLPLGTPIAALERIKGDDIPITSIDILNEDTPFAIDANGVIRTTDYIDRRRKSEYDLVAVARSAKGNSNKIYITIYVDDVYPAASLTKLSDFKAIIPENIVNNSVIGTLHIDVGESPVDAIRIYGDTGTDDFVIDKNGTIRVAPNANIDFEKKRRYEFKTIAYNHNGGSNIAKIVIDVSNVADTVPDISGFTAYYRENTPLDANITVGKIRVLDQGESNITAYHLVGSDSQYFTVDDNGTVRLKQSMGFDFETKSSYQFYAVASNNIGRSNQAEINSRP